MKTSTWIGIIFVALVVVVSVYFGTSLFSTVEPAIGGSGPGDTTRPKATAYKNPIEDPNAPNPSFDVYRKQAELAKQKADANRARSERMVREMENEGRPPEQMDQPAPQQQQAQVENAAPAEADPETMLRDAGRMIDDKKFTEAGSILDEIDKLTLTAEQTAKVNSLRERIYKESAQSANGF